MIISKDVIYTSLENIMEADMIEMILRLKIQKFLCLKITKK